MTRASGEGLLLGQKFAALVAPRLGPEGASRLRDAIEHLDDVEDAGELTR